MTKPCILKIWQLLWTPDASLHSQYTPSINKRRKCFQSGLDPKTFLRSTSRPHEAGVRGKAGGSREWMGSERSKRCDLMNSRVRISLSFRLFGAAALGCFKSKAADKETD
jgi:hypothetical protein